MTTPLEPSLLIDWVADAGRRTLALVEGLDDAELMGPRLHIVNPTLWEIGHVAWFYEYFLLRRLDGGAPRLANADALYNSSLVPHDARWDLPLPDLYGTLDYLHAVREATIARLRGRPVGANETALALITIFHEDMHGEALTYTRQTLGYPAPAEFDESDEDAGPWLGDAEVPGGEFMLGSAPRAAFAFDNEKWAHPVTVAPFRIAKAPVTNAAFLDFVVDGGYRRRDLWDEEGWDWRQDAAALCPAYWREQDGVWRERRFDRWQTLRPHRPVVYVNWHEANAWCRWAGRRLPSEAEWETAAAAEPAPAGGLGVAKRRYPWGDHAPNPARANLDGRRLGPVDVAARAAGDSAWGCRQMLGNVWEWTMSPFLPYPGFSPDAYADYSAPWFGSRKVLRGGAFATRGRMISAAYRNFFTPERRDVLAGFRTCAL
jgi:iron(II)-dependent oxidoreductase